MPGAASLRRNRRGHRGLRPSISCIAVALLLAAGWWSAAHAAEPVAAAPRCDVPAELRLGPLSLPESAARIAAGRPVTIVALGAASTAGYAARDPQQTYPAQLERHLHELLPDVRLEVINAGMPRDTTAAMMARLHRDVLSHNPSLVIWEVGTNDAESELDLGSFIDLLQSGIETMRGRHADVILMNMQYARATAALIDFEPYLDAIERIAALEDVPMLNRWAIMQGWSDSGEFQFEHPRPGTGTEIARRVYDCLASALAADIARALQPAQHAIPAPAVQPSTAAPTRAGP